MSLGYAKASYEKKLKKRIKCKNLMSEEAKHRSNNDISIRQFLLVVIVINIMLTNLVTTQILKLSAWKWNPQWCAQSLTLSTKPIGPAPITQTSSSNAPPFFVSRFFLFS